MLRRTVIILALAGVCLATSAVAPDALAQGTSRRSLSERFFSLRNVFKRDSSKGQSRYGRSDQQPKPPMPYDPEDLVKDSVNNRNNQSAAPIEPEVVAAQPSLSSIGDRTARRSPASLSRQSELDEALADLLAPTPSKAAARVGDKITPPTAAGAEGLPSYLHGLADEVTDGVSEEVVESDVHSLSPAEVQAGRSNPFDFHNVLAGDTAAGTKPAGISDTTDSNPTPAADTDDDEVEESVEQSVEESAATEESDRVVVAERTPNVEVEATPADADEAPVEVVPVIQPVPNQNPPTDDLPDMRRQQAAASPEMALPNPAPQEVRDPAAAQQAFAEPTTAAEEVEFGALEPSPDQSSSSRGSAASQSLRDDPNVLFSYQQPVIRSSVEGPRRIIVGHPATYQVTLQNSGDTGAQELTATVDVPSGAEVIESSPSLGVVRQEADENGSQALRWRLRELPAGAKQTLTMRLIPRSGQPLQLGVRWSHAPVGSTATVEVQEPKLAMAISGPADVLYGKPQRFRLSLSNPGTGPAENVTIQLTPPGGGETDVIHHPVGNLAAGATTEIELELVAREAGDLIVQAGAVGAGGLHTNAAKQVVCRQPELQIDWRGPEKKYAGTVATYYFRVRNPGTAATDRFAVDLKLPRGAELLAASEGHTVQEGGLVRWNSLPLSPGDERFMQVRCKLTLAGKNDISITAETTEADLRDRKAFHTDVIALADLKLEVSDPKGPIAVGDDALYTVRVVNRGSTAARGVNVVALFSSGIDPTTVEGAQYTLNDGRVAFQPISALPAGRDFEFRIRAKATQPGNHVFRAEVLCQDLDIKLSAEETTRFFTDDQRWEDASTAYSSSPDETVR